MPTPERDHPFVSRGGVKLRHALDAFTIDARGLVCADLGASTGGFTDCLLQAGVARVHALDTAYGELAWKLRNDPRVVVRERTNALYAEPPAEGVALVVVDLGWTPQRLVVPAALRWLAPGGRIISLIKPHYERSDRERAAGWDPALASQAGPEQETTGQRQGLSPAPNPAPNPPPNPAQRSRRVRASPVTAHHLLTDEEAHAETDRVIALLPTLGVRVAGVTRSPIRGGSDPKKGNAEWLVLLEPAATRP
ncbi:MAG: SAM-dependent methyltransferase [Planctomycetota bacterium]|nr:SAM-dependent methyltransferase [Planctomycetota bacterium]